MTFRDIQSLSKPKSAQPIVRRIGQYVATMKSLKKPLTQVVLTKADYDLILRSVRANRAEHEPEISGLRFDDIRVVRSGT